MRFSVSGLVASLGCLIITMVFLYGNPYSDTPANKGTVIFFYVLLIAPALVGAIASILKNRALMYIVFVSSLPCGLYMTVASIPSVGISSASLC